MHFQVVVIGNLTIDQNFSGSLKYVGPGGSVYFATRTFKNLGIKTTIISSYGEDFPKKNLSKIDILPPQADLSQTLVFINKTDKNGKRIQTVDNYHQLPRIQPSRQSNKLTQNADIVMVAPILANIQLKQIKFITHRYKQSLKLLLPQGFFRKINLNGKIKCENWADANIIIPLFDIVVASDKDYPKIEESALNWSKMGPIVIITQEGKGCLIYQNGTYMHIPAFRAERIVDSTGCGDIFAAAFAYAYSNSRSITDSAVFAHAAACLSLPYLSNQLQYGYQDIIDFSKKRGREIKYEHHHR